MKVSLVMASFDRARQLAFSLQAIAKQTIPWDFEIVVVNDGKEDDGTQDVCSNFSSNFDIKYIFAGQRNEKGLIIRNPAVPNNIAVKNSSGEIIILTCPELYHMSEGVQSIVLPLIEKRNVMTIPLCLLWDVNGAVLNSLPSESPDLSSGKLFGVEKTKYPYLLGMWKSEFVSIGGYDEDFTGFGSEDDDLIMRLRFKRLKHHPVSVKGVHLWHPPPRGMPEWDAGRAYNRELLKTRTGIIKRNQNRPWGNL